MGIDSNAVLVADNASGSTPVDMSMPMAVDSTRVIMHPNSSIKRGHEARAHGASRKTTKAVTTITNAGKTMSASGFSNEAVAGRNRSTIIASVRRDVTDMAIQGASRASVSMSITGRECENILYFLAHIKIILNIVCWY